MKKLKKVSIALSSFLIATLAFLGTGLTKNVKAMSYDRFEQTFISPVTLDSFARATADSNGDPKVVTTGNAVMNVPALSFEYDKTTHDCMIYASANKKNTGKKYFAIKYKATGDVKDTHFTLNCNTDVDTLGVKSFSELWAPEADNAGITFNTTGEESVIVIDINTSWNLDLPNGPSYVNDFRLGFVSDDSLETTQNIIITEIYRTDVPMSLGYDRTEGDIMVDDFVRAEKIVTAPDYHWMYGDFTHLEAGFKMTYTETEAATYTVTSEKYTNVNNQYKYLSALMKGTDGNSVYMYLVKEDGSYSNSVKFNDLILEGDAKATLSENFETYNIDLGKNFGTSKCKGIRLECRGAEGTVSISSLKYSTYDYAPYGFNNEDVTIDLDMDLASEYPFYDFTGNDVAGESLNWIFSRNITKNADNSITFRVNDGYYQSSPKNGANYSNSFDYVVMEISGDDSANDNLEICFFSDSGFGDYWVKVPNLYKAPGVSCGEITSEKKTFIIDLAANQYTYMGFGRINKNCDGVRIRTVGDTNATIYSIYFANAKVEADYRAYTYVTEGNDARIRFSVNNDRFVEVNGNDIESDNYRFAGGVLTIKKDYLETLGTGTYTFTCKFELAGDLTFTVNVEEKEEIAPPTNTEPGDNTNPENNQPSSGENNKGCKSIISLSVVSLLLPSLAFVAIKKKREE